MDAKQKQTPLLALIRLRGTVNVPSKLKDTLKMLRVERPNYMTLIPKTPEYMGMIKKVKDFVTWGEVSKETIEYILRKRGELTGRKKLTDEYLKENTEYSSIAEFASALFEGSATLKDIPQMKRFFRLHPPRKGFKAVKKGFAEGGDLGYRGTTINELIVRMA
ncbi:MAG: 50S ribosomal protein L30 [Candidatus Heimdallarchaeaceae archaeon]